MLPWLVSDSPVFLLLFVPDKSDWSKGNDVKTASDTAVWQKHGNKQKNMIGTRIAIL